MMRISQKGLDFIKGFESFVAYVYDDKVPARNVNGRLTYRQWKKGDPVIGTLTIGYGHTDAAKYNLGRKLADLPDGFMITQQQALQILDVDLDECEMYVNTTVKVSITQGMFDALTSFCFNCGPGALARIVERLNRGNYAAARAAFDLYIYSGTQKMRGLQRRRDGEQALWDDGELPEWQTEVVVDHPAEVDLDTVPIPPASMAQSSEGNAAVATGAAGTTTTAILVSTAVKNAAGAKAFTLSGFLIALASQPEFWGALIAGVLMIGGPAYLWFKRASDLKSGVR
jgi:GH24 family phage-related lysozyme (muramidase)